MWISFLYERLPSFYFKCGIIKHGVNGCLMDYISTSMHCTIKSKYAAWLRASSLRDTTKNSWNGYGRKEKTGSQTSDSHDEDDDMVGTKANYGKEVGSVEEVVESVENPKIDRS